MSAAVILSQKLFGLIELDADWKVIYSRIERDGGQLLPAANITGRNFYSEVVPFQNVEEFQNCLESFRQSPLQANSIAFTCRYDDGPVQVKVLMTRIQERSEGGMSKSILLHIRKA